MSITKHYLNYPEWNSEEDDMQQDILRHMYKLANECAGLAMFIADIFDRPDSEWRLEDLENMEKIHHELTALCGFIKTTSIKE
jgi:hypothetical protein